MWTRERSVGCEHYQADSDSSCSSEGTLTGSRNEKKDRQGRGWLGHEGTMGDGVFGPESQEKRLNWRRREGFREGWRLGGCESGRVIDECDRCTVWP